MGSDNIRSIGVRNVMTLQCGNSAAVDALNSKRDEIKNALAQGKDALADLESKAAEALSAIEGVKVPIPEIPLPNLQEDINSVVTSLTSGIDIANPLSGASALTSLPGKIAEFTSTWSGVLPADEVQSYIDTMTSTVTNAVTDPTSLLDFDPCKQFPNKIIETAADGTQKEAVKAKGVETPTVNAVKPEESAPPAPTPQVFLQEQPDQKPSEASPSGYTRSSVLQDWKAVIDPIRTRRKEHFIKAKSDAKDAIRAYRSANDAVRKTIMAMMKSTGKKPAQLSEENKFNEDQQKYWEEFSDLKLKFQLVGVRQSNYILVEMCFIEYLMEEMTEDEWTELKKKYQEKSPEDQALWEQAEAELTAGKAAVVAWQDYLNVKGGYQKPKSKVESRSSLAS